MGPTAVPDAVGRDIADIPAAMARIQVILKLGALYNTFSSTNVLLQWFYGEKRFDLGKGPTVVGREIADTPAAAARIQVFLQLGALYTTFRACDLVQTGAYNGFMARGVLSRKRWDPTAVADAVGRDIARFGESVS